MNFIDLNKVKHPISIAKRETEIKKPVRIKNHYKLQERWSQTFSLKERGSREKALRRERGAIGGERERDAALRSASKKVRHWGERSDQGERDERRERKIGDAASKER